jgi:hypothetical protein
MDVMKRLTIKKRKRYSIERKTQFLVYQFDIYTNTILIINAVTPYLMKLNSNFKLAFF